MASRKWQRKGPKATLLRVNDCQHLVHSRRPLADTNELIERLPPEERSRFFSESEERLLNLGETLCEVDDPLTRVLFPLSSFISLTTSVQAAPRSALEVAMVGREGVVGVSVILGVNTAPHRAIVQGQGAVRSMPTQTFRLQLESSPQFRRLMQRYLFVQLQQITTTAACTHFHQIEQRLARWLLMSHDRSHESRFPVTQEFLGLMLGVQRVGVTRAAGNLQRRELIRYQRGFVTVMDRSGLEAASCACYAKDRADARKVMHHEAR